MELETILRVLVRKWYIILPIFLVTLIATVIFTRNQPRIYEAKATYIAKLSPSTLNGKDFANILDILSSRVEIPSTYAEVANSRSLYALTSQKLGLSPEGRHNLTINSRLIAGTNILEIAVQGTDPVLARDFANALGESTIGYVQNLYETYTLAPLDEAVTPSSPIQPNVPLNLAFGGVLGLALGVIFALLIHYFQTMGKNSSTLPSMPFIETGQEVVSSAQDASVIKLQQDMAVVQDQYKAMKLVLNQIEIALQRNNTYTRDIRSIVHDLDKQLHGNHVSNGKGKSGRDEI